MYLFFLVTRPPPRSTLFPYTTLCRSRDPEGAPAAAREREGDEAVAADGGRHVDGDPADPRGASRSEEHSGPRRGAEGDAADRKSTRLNSSHANISYAVFCLKQKTHPC